MSDTNDGGGLSAGNAASGSGYGFGSSGYGQGLNAGTAAAGGGYGFGSSGYGQGLNTGGGSRYQGSYASPSLDVIAAMPNLATDAETKAQIRNAIDQIGQSGLSDTDQAKLQSILGNMVAGPTGIQRDVLRGFVNMVSTAVGLPGGLISLASDKTGLLDSMVNSKDPAGEISKAVSSMKDGTFGVQYGKGGGQQMATDPQTTAAAGGQAATTTATAVDPGMSFLDSLYAPAGSAAATPSYAYGSLSTANGGVPMVGAGGGGGGSGTSVDSATQLANINTYGNNVATAAGQAALGIGQDAMKLNAAYLNEYLPYDRKLMGYVDSIGTDAYRAQQRGQAMTSVQQQIDAARQTNMRDMARMGINPNSARFAATNGLMAQQGALNKTMAATNSDRASREDWVKGLGAVNAMGTKVAGVADAQLGRADSLMKTGMTGSTLGIGAKSEDTKANASMVGAGASAQNAANGAAGLALQAKQLANTRDLGLGELALKRYNIDTQNSLARDGLNYKIDSTDLGSTLGGALIGAGTNAVVDNIAKNGISSTWDSFVNIFK